MDESVVIRKSEEDQEQSNFAGVINANMNIAAAQTHYDKFHAAQGHGFAAEQANTLYDRLTGKEAVIVGGDNAKDGADRRVNGVNIQSKYCQYSPNGCKSVAAAFEQGPNGTYRYYNSDGTPMQLEVPKGQYNQAVQEMESRIAKGRVPGVTDVSEAKRLIREGNITYEQAVNITKFGTIESLTYDAVNGAVMCASAMGITAAITFARSLWNGDSVDIAVENAAYSGLKTYGAGWASYLISGQIMRTSMNKTLVGPTKTAIKFLGKGESGTLANALRNGANVSGADAMADPVKLLKGNALSAAVMLLVLSAGDIRNAFRGRISGKQLFKNIATTAGGLAGAAAGSWVVLNVIAPSAGGIAAIVIGLAGGTAGGAAGSSATNRVVGKFAEDDAVELAGIIENSFCQLAQDYMLSEDEVDIILEDLAIALSGEALLDMYASPDHAAYADRIVRRQIERLVRGRCRVRLPSDDKIAQGIERVFIDAENGTGIFSQNRIKVDPVEVGRELTGAEYSEHAAKKGMYAVKQMNLAQGQAEMRLKKMAADEEKAKRSINAIYQERDILKGDLNALLGGKQNEQ